MRDSCISHAHIFHNKLAFHTYIRSASINPSKMLSLARGFQSQIRIASSSVAHQQCCLLHNSAVLERARKGTRERKRKIIVANTKKRADRLRKNPPPLPTKVKLMMISKGIPLNPKKLRSVFFIETFHVAKYTSQAFNSLSCFYKKFAEPTSRNWSSPRMTSTT